MRHCPAIRLPSSDCPVQVGHHPSIYKPRLPRPRSAQLHPKISRPPPESAAGPVVTIVFRLLFPARKRSSFQPHESADPVLCTAGCGFFGSPATKDMCSVCCKKNHCIVTDAASSTATASEPVPRSAVAAKPAVPAPAASSVSFAPAKGAIAEPTVPSSSAPEPATKAQPSRCAACYKKVGLTGFVCRCEKTFSGKHRYAEEHGCAFDFNFKGYGA